MDIGSVKEVLTSVKTTLSAAGATFVAGMSSVINLIPDDIGKLASAVGVIVTVFLAWLQYRRNKRDAIESELRAEQLRLENEQLTRQLRGEKGKPAASRRCLT